ncbi:MAG: ABC transporter permease [Chloroflexi bacterium]|nr:ABC transporter permease [Chloroflexota bacterium]
MPFYLALKEIWRGRGRFILFSLVIALITVLVLFVAALAEGLGAGNRNYIEKLNADLIAYQANVDLSIGASRIGQNRLNQIRRLDGVAAVGPIATASASLVFADGRAPLNVALIGVEPGMPGEPPAVTGAGLRSRRGKEAMLDRQVALRTGLKVGDTFTVKSIQATEEQFYDLRVVGISDNRQYSLQPSVVLPIRTWDQIRPQAAVGGVPDAEIVANIVGVRVADPAQAVAVAQRIKAQVKDVVAVDRATAYQATPGYSAQQSTLNTQRYFALLIGILVIGGFFQILTLQKVAQIGMLKAIGAANTTVGLSAIIQIVAVTMSGVFIGAAATMLLSLGFPPTIPIVFAPSAVWAAIGSLLLIGPIGGLVSVRYSLKVEPLTALGLAS